MSQALPCPRNMVEHAPEPRTSPAVDTIPPAPFQPHLLNSPPRPGLTISTATAPSHGDVPTGKSWAETVEDPRLPLILTLDGKVYEVTQVCSLLRGSRTNTPFRLHVGHEYRWTNSHDAGPAANERTRLSCLLQSCWK